MQLRPYQRDCLENIRAKYRAGRRRILVALPTGTGKTVVFAQLPTFFQMKKRMLVLAHRQELIDQAVEKFRVVAPDLAVGVEQSARRATPDARVVVASVPTLGRGDTERLLQLNPEDFYVIVIDEAHHAVAATYRRVLDHFRVFEPDSRRLVVGFTATPRRGDKQSLAKVFEEIAFARSLPEMIRDGFLSPIRGWRVRTDVELDHVRVRRGDFVEGELAHAVDTPERNRVVVDAYGELAARRRAIVFAAGVEHAQRLAEAFEASGTRAAAVWGAMGGEERARTLRRFREGALEVLTNCNVLTEGYDEPRVDCVIMARPTKSQLLYAQMVGRGTRLHPDKSDLVVIDIVDNSRRHRLAGLSALFDLPDSLDLAGHSAIEVSDEVERVAREYPWIDTTRATTAAELATVTERIEFFRFEPPEKIAPYTSLTWCRSPDGGYRLFLTDGEWIGLREDNLGRWEIAVRAAGQAHPVPAKSTVGKLADAVRAADAAVARHRPEAMRVVTMDAGWRDEAPTDKQLAYLVGRKIPTPPALTRGQASWMITLSKQGRRPR